MAEGTAGFWSYTHRDDDHEAGRITKLARDIASEFEMLTGEHIEIFIDRDSLEWGAAWQSRIDTALRETTFFFPVITPRYFTSESCRAELIKFSGYARSLGVEQLLMPLYYVEVDDFHTENPDQAIALVAGSQYLDWRERRFLETTSVEYRQAVNSAARDIAAKAAQVVPRSAAELAPIAEAAGLTDDDSDDDEPGYIDLVAQLETELPRATSVLAEYTDTMDLAAGLMNANVATVEAADAAGKPFSYRLTLARELAASLDAPAHRMLELANDYYSGLEGADPGVRAIIRAAEEQQPTGEDLAAICEFFRQVRSAAETTGLMAASARTVEGIMQGTGRLSRDLRPVIRLMRGATLRVADGQAIVDGWVQAVDATSLDC